MFFNKDTKIFATLQAVEAEADLALLDSSNLIELSAVTGISVDSVNQSRMFLDGSNVIDLSDVNRGVHVEPGDSLSYTINIQTLMCTTNTVTNNSILWESLLTTIEPGVSAIKAEYFDAQHNGQQLQDFTLIIVNNNIAEVYTKCMVNTLSMGANMASLLSLSWNIVVLDKVPTTIVSMVGNALYISGVNTPYVVQSDVEYVVDRFMLLSIGALAVPAVSLNISITNNVTLIDSNVLDTFDNDSSYSLGTLQITGSISTYSRLGGIKALADTIHQAYLAGTVPELFFSLIINSSSRQLKLSLGNIFIEPSSTSRDNVLTNTWNFTVNNYYSNTFRLEVVIAP